MQAHVGEARTGLPHEERPSDDDVPVPHVVHREAQAGGGARHGSAAVLEAMALLRRERGRRTRLRLTRRAERVAQGGTRGSGPRPRTPRRRTGGRTAQEPPKPRLDPPDRHEGLSLP